MTAGKKLGVWMDHSSAHITIYEAEPAATQDLESTKINHSNDHGSSGNENITNNKDQNKQAEYYKKLAELIKNYDAVLLFGPTDAKLELFNVLKADHHFDNIKIDVLSTDKMTENQEHAFVAAHFSK
ncbi:MAG TPA: hypothetical protein PLC89_10565 [Haliscomenobacter sp.]|uniref:hypothetical protein n=1 Tax=Haliscomenobacter sp. TaxID=2717303 RepID=UPI002CB3A54F|nr:hypothetical protein [Haliscomenobacter sp.]HOY17730.1 hypothetical protein [Haliscomenobacter sp.]HPH18611.1 hypothetical protein [Haliscomenobacter sp.]